MRVADLGQKSEKIIELKKECGVVMGPRTTEKEKGLNAINLPVIEDRIAPESGNAGIFRS